MGLPSPARHGRAPDHSVPPQPADAGKPCPPAPAPWTHAQSPVLTLIPACPFPPDPALWPSQPQDGVFAKASLCLYLEDGFYAPVGAGGGSCLFYIINSNVQAIKMSLRCLWKYIDPSHLTPHAKSEGWIHFSASSACRLRACKSPLTPQCLGVGGGRGEAKEEVIYEWDSQEFCP